ncbi:hypothetical protein DFH28DRAFT_1046709 [Melampsora americana]|nr:hypothetical protein DFH28DRAFT_1046709 [Melampsora americana]
MALAKVSKDKLASKEADRKEDVKFRDERQARLDQMLIERDVQMETLRNERKAEHEANALERLRLSKRRIQAKVERFPNQVKALETFRAEVHNHIVDQDDKIKAAVKLNVEEKAFLFNQLPEDMRWDWLKNEIKNN